jgi:uncharacterized protein YjbI with pentapeptide repeats
MNTKLEILNKFRSPNNQVVLGAVEALRVRGWLQDGTLQSQTFCRAQLQGADLMSADLSGVDFHQARLDWSDLSGANLRGARFTRAILAFANFAGTELHGADFYKANLRGAIHLDDWQFSTVSRLWGATMPDGQTYDGRYNLPGDIALAQWNKVDLHDPDQMAAFYGVSTQAYLNGQGLDAVQAFQPLALAVS